MSQSSSDSERNEDAVISHEETESSVDVMKFSHNNETVVVKPPSMTMALFVYWIVPVFILAVFSRFAVEGPSAINRPSKPIALNLNSNQDVATRSHQHNIGTGKRKIGKAPVPPTPTPSSSQSKHPSSYQEALEKVNRKRKRKVKKPSPSSVVSEATHIVPEPSSQKSVPDTRGRNDPQRQQLENSIRQRRKEFKADPNNVLKALSLADALRLYDLTYHEGGFGQVEAIETYQHAIDLTMAKRHKMIEAGEPTNISLRGTYNVQDELMLESSERSVDGLLCGTYTNQGKQYFMANMFEKAVESYTKCIELEPLYLDAVGARGSSLIILGRYAEAGHDFTVVMENDKYHLFIDIFSGMAKVLGAKEEAVPQGWDRMVSIVNDLIPYMEGQISATSNTQARALLVDSLKRLHHVMFIYHDVKTMDTEAAWDHLSRAYKYKMSVLPSWNNAFEKDKVASLKSIFHKGFWPTGVGSPSQVPVFIIGFVRSGSTLLERVLDAHPKIVGTGEDSVFNGKLDKIRNSIVDASLSGSSERLAVAVRERADEVVEDIRKRWEVIDANTEKSGDSRHEAPERFADKMLTNYYNVGFIHLLFPNALILHVAREPMDTIFSAYKHEFPPGTLDYTSEFKSLANLYHTYRDIIEHWDDVLPGRITHVRYEDMVHDMPGMAKAIINATGLAWDEDVLNFHKKKHAVNTHSTTQVRKGVYKDSLESWKRYEGPLEPLVKLVGDRVQWELKTTLPSYTRPSGEE